eukprot:3940876-Rhodomonas_salina.3
MPLPVPGFSGTDTEIVRYQCGDEAGEYETSNKLAIAYMRAGTACPLSPYSIPVSSYAHFPINLCVVS